jgi:hypothetical protein
MSETAQHQLWTITVVDQGGDQEHVRENEHVHLAQLLSKGVKALYSEHANVGDYVLEINGTDEQDLSKTLAEAGLHDRSEVVILPRDVSRG